MNQNHFEIMTEKVQVREQTANDLMQPSDY